MGGLGKNFLDKKIKKRDTIQYRILTFAEGTGFLERERGHDSYIVPPNATTYRANGQKGFGHVNS